jgi:hypothetical protein
MLKIKRNIACLFPLRIYPGYKSREVVANLERGIGEEGRGEAMSLHPRGHSSTME